jgi:hypothetical protein
MQKRSSNNMLDINQLAKSITDKATGELLQKANAEGKDPLAVLLGQRGGLKGGKARAIKLSAEQRSEIAKNAANKRWKNRKIED